MPRFPRSAVIGGCRMRRSWSVVVAGVVAVAASGAVLSASSGGASAADSYYQKIPRPHCGAGSVPETGVQGQVPPAERAARFAGFSCNLKLLGQSQGEGASWQHTWYD